jgi:phosphoglucomutase
MYAIILAGGSGTRLWPLSRELFPKQYLGLLNDQQSLFQTTVERVLTTVPEERTIIVTHVDQAAEIKRQLGLSGRTGIRLLEEPEARNTAAAIGLAAWQLLHEAGPDAVMAVLPSDHLIPDRKEFAALLRAGETAAHAYGLVTFGIRPTCPETGYGYICAGESLGHGVHRVEKFVEKPDLETAKSYLADSRYLWNSGMFVFRVGALVEQYRQLLPAMHATLGQIDYVNPGDLEAIYRTLEKTSIDYGILERASGVTLIPTAINWSDLGSWEAYYQVSSRDEKENYLKGRVLAIDTEGTMVYSTSRLVGAVGLKDLVIVDTDDALLVCDRHQTQGVKKIVDQLNAEGAAEAREHRTVYRPWGSYTSLEMSETYQVKRINVNPGARLSLQSHRRRAENWVVVSGEALVTVDDQKVVVKKGESIFVPQGARHRMENTRKEPLVLIEVQNGDYLGEDDIIRYEDDYGRTPGVPVKDDSREKLGNTENLSAAARTHFEEWLAFSDLDPEMRLEIEAFGSDAAKIESHFGSELVFGTGGMRGLTGPGLNRINCYTIRRATQGLANYLNKQPARSDGLKQVAIAYDTRHQSAEFAQAAALVLAANGIKALFFSSIRPTPMLSYTTRELGCAAGIVITASHNPPQYNGYKVYGPDGGQAVSPLVDDLISEIKPIAIFDAVKSISRKEALNAGLFELIDPALDQSYLEQVSALSLSNPQECIKVVFTALHGTGLVYIPSLLTQSHCVDLSLVEEQMTADADFSTVRVPNPEDPAALDMALSLARRVEADLVLATDPDGDRVGTAVRDQDGSYVILSGNRVGALLIEYICSRLAAKGAMPENPVLVKTIVTGELGRRVAESYGLHTIETLTGFKFIGEQIKHFKAQEGGPHFVFGYEESCGYLTGTFVRDKDAMISSLLIAEMTAYYKEAGKNLLQVLDELHQRHGYFAEDLLTVELQDISQAGRHVAAYHKLPAEFAGQKVALKRDYGKRTAWDYANDREYKLDLPQSPVLHYTLADGSWFAVRPSGTEPKVKFYLSVSAPTATEAGAKLAHLRSAILAQASENKQ